MFLSKTGRLPPLNISASFGTLRGSFTIYTLDTYVPGGGIRRTDVLAFTMERGFKQSILGPGVSTLLHFL